jgi:hypothetical protein
MEDPQRRRHRSGTKPTRPDMAHVPSRPSPRDASG